MKKELEELCNKYGFELRSGSELSSGAVVYEIKEKKPIFVNTIGEKFYDDNVRVYWFTKHILGKCADFLYTERKDNYTEGDIRSQIYKTPESRDKALEEYKESLKPKYRAFKLEEADEYLGMKIRHKHLSEFKVVGTVIGQTSLDLLFRNYIKLSDGSSVGKLI